jgi:hypothetical protein
MFFFSFSKAAHAGHDELPFGGADGFWARGFCLRRAYSQMYHTTEPKQVMQVPHPGRRRCLFSQLPKARSIRFDLRTADMGEFKIPISKDAENDRPWGLLSLHQKSVPETLKKKVSGE